VCDICLDQQVLQLQPPQLQPPQLQPPQLQPPQLQQVLCPPPPRRRKRRRAYDIGAAAGAAAAGAGTRKQVRQANLVFTDRQKRACSTYLRILAGLAGYERFVEYVAQSQSASYPEALRKLEPFYRAVLECKPEALSADHKALDVGLEALTPTTELVDFAVIDGTARVFSMYPDSCVKDYLTYCRHLFLEGGASLDFLRAFSARQSAFYGGRLKAHGSMMFSCPGGTTVYSDILFSWLVLDVFTGRELDGYSYGVSLDGGHALKNETLTGKIIEFLCQHAENEIFTVTHADGNDCYAVKKEVRVAIQALLKSTHPAPNSVVDLTGDALSGSLEDLLPADNAMLTAAELLEVAGIFSADFGGAAAAAARPPRPAPASARSTEAAIRLQMQRAATDAAATEAARRRC
jgi:hypothetical protein